MSCNWLLRAEKIHNMSLPEHNYICLVHKGNQREKDVKMSACHISSPVVGALPWVFLGAHRDFSTLGLLLEWNAESCCFPCTGELLFLVLFPSLDFPFTYTQCISMFVPAWKSDCATSAASYSSCAAEIKWSFFHHLKYGCGHPRWWEERHGVNLLGKVRDSGILLQWLFA